MPPKGGSNFSDHGISLGAIFDRWFQDGNGNMKTGYCTAANVPTDGSAGYAVGCQIYTTDTGVEFLNTGTTASCAFRMKPTGSNVVAIKTNGTFNVNVFGATNGFVGTILGAYLIAADGTAANITITNAGVTVATIAKGTSSGAVVGAASVASTAITVNGTMVVVSSVGSASGGQATVFIVFTA